MSLIRYPIASDAQGALIQGVSSAARASDAAKTAGAHVVFTSEWVGPVFADKESALTAWAGRVEDDRPRHVFIPAAEARYCRLVCRTANALEANANTSGKRTPGAVWQLSVSFWKIMAAGRPATGPAKGQARKLRKSAKGTALSPGDVQGLANAPLQPYQIQKGLDFGLFDFVPPDNPNIVIADE